MNDGFDETDEIDDPLEKMDESLAELLPDDADDADNCGESGIAVQGRRLVDRKSVV